MLGDANLLEIDQANMFGPGFANTALLSQTGDHNSAWIAQEIAPGGLTGGLNQAGIFQNGTDHVARIEQAGADNTALIEQDGSANTGTILQDGTGLQAAIRQSGTGLDYTINQTGCVTGGCSPILVTQTGP